MENNEENKIKLMIIEDNDNQMKEIVNYFKNTKDFDVIATCGDGGKALELLKTTVPDAILLDIVLPTYDGFELLSRIKEENIFKSIKPKIIVMSSLKNETFAQKALSMGADYYMVKPVDYLSLSKRITYLINSDAVVSQFPIKNSKNRVLDEKISKIFITVGIPAHIKGYQFLREAIKMAIDNPEIINSITKQLYPNIATRFETSASKVERAIRHAIEVAWNRGKIENINNLFGLQVYNSNEKPTNGEFIALVADKMLIEGA